MKTLNLFLFTILFTGIFNHCAFSQEQNCEEAKKKYLIENPDVAKAGMDAWSHYTYYGKKEGRKWPDCSNINQNQKANINSGIITKPILVDTGKLAETIKYVQELGAKSDLVGNFYNLQYVHQEFDFYNEPLAVIDAKVDASLGSQYAKSEKEKLENLLKGYLELKRQDSIVTQKLKKYGECSTGDCSRKIETYNKVKQSVQVINFDRELWSVYSKQMQKYCDGLPSNVIFYKLNTVEFPNSIENLDKSNCKDAILSYYKNMIESKSNSSPNIEDLKTVEYCLLKYRGKYPQLKEIILRLVTPPRDKNKFSIKNLNYYSRNTLNALYQYYYFIGNDVAELCRYGKSHQVSVYKIIEKAITNHPEIIVPDNQKMAFIEKETGLDEEFFRLKDQKVKLSAEISFLEKYIFIALPKRGNSYGNFTYIGNSTNGIPNGLGYLLNEQKQLITIAHWDEGFPVVLYNVNLYQNPEKNGKDYVYYVDNFSKKYASNYIHISSHGYEGKNVNTFRMYLGGYVYVSNENSNYKDGYGCFFYSDWDKNYKQYFTGSFKKSDKQGKGTHFNNYNIYEGEWEEGRLVYGSITSKSDKSIYTGQIKDWKMNGEGKKVYANGKVEEGIFENGNYKMTKNQYTVELNRKEQQRIEEEIRQDVVNTEQNNPISQHRNYIKSKLYASNGALLVYGKEASDNIFKELLNDLQQYHLKRKLTKNDQEYIKTVMQEVASEVQFTSQMNQKMQQNNRQVKCSRCDKKYYSIDGWDIIRPEDCSLIEQKYVEMANGNYGKFYCTEKCAKCACQEKKGINCKSDK